MASDSIELTTDVGYSDIFAIDDEGFKIAFDYFASLTESDSFHQFLQRKVFLKPSFDYILTGKILRNNNLNHGDTLLLHRWDSIHTPSEFLMTMALDEVYNLGKKNMRLTFSPE